MLGPGSGRWGRGGREGGGELLAYATVKLAPTYASRFAP